MKKAAIVLALIMALSVFASCGRSAGSGSGSSGNTGTSAESGSTGDETAAFDPALMKTMADIYSSVNVEDDGSGVQESYTEKQYVIVFDVDGIYYRAAVNLPEDVSEALWNIEFDDPDKSAKMKELLSPLEIASFENLTDQIPSQETLDKYVGKTGQELFDEGWNYWYYNLDEMSAGLNYGPFAYTVLFEYDGEPMENTDDFDFYEEFKDLKVSAVTYDGIGDAANPE